jgi:hypothetical protein
MKMKWFLGGLIIVLCSAFVLASDNAPPALPTELWGQALIDGNDAPPGTAITSPNGDTTVGTDGSYDLMLTGGDHELTNISDADCAIAWGAGNACIPCSTNPADPDYCIEGPQAGDVVVVSFDGNPVEVTWDADAPSSDTYMTQYHLYSGWNMISMPVLRDDTSIQNYMDDLTGHRVAFFYDGSDAADHWKGYDSNTPSFTWDLLTMEPAQGYWLQLDSDQVLSFIGKGVADTSIELYTGWNMVGSQLYTDTIENAMAGLTGHKVAFHYDGSDAADHWKGYDSNTPSFTWDLTNIEVGRGYWLWVDSDQTWEAN